jgi:hypothetical protein
LIIALFAPIEFVVSASQNKFYWVLGTKAIGIANMVIRFLHYLEAAFANRVELAGGGGCCVRQYNDPLQRGGRQICEEKEDKDLHNMSLLSNSKPSGKLIL